MCKNDDKNVILEYNHSPGSKNSLKVEDLECWDPRWKKVESLEFWKLKV